MHCIEALHEQLEKCEPCRYHAIIVDYEKLPPNQQSRLEMYNEEMDFILYCQKCDFFELLRGFLE
jgi:hypothetical protein